MAQRKPGLVLVDKKNQSAASTALEIAPAALIELLPLLPADQPYTPLIRAALVAVKAYIDRMEHAVDPEREKLIQSIKKTREQIMRIPAGDPRRDKLWGKLERDISKL